MYFSIEKLLPHVYHLRFGTTYDAAMHFIRFQEYYESPKFYKTHFTIAEYMRWYSAKYGKGNFTYTTDWTGFNVPSWALLDVRHEGVLDRRREDVFMECLIDSIAEEEGDSPFYFIGTSIEGEKDEGKNLLDHEIAHALYWTDASYRGEVTSLLRAWDGPNDLGFDGSELDSAKDVLGPTMGYHPSTILDEVHAYCATGLAKELNGVISKRVTEHFRKLFQKYKKEHLK